MSHTNGHSFTLPTASPDLRACAYPKCKETMRVVVSKPAAAVESSQTSVAAARAIEGGPRTQGRALVLAAVQHSPDGLTDQAIQEATGLVESSERPRRVELVEANLLYDSGRQRITRSGRMASVWRART